jgi:hypothetical protein
MQFYAAANPTNVYGNLAWTQVLGTAYYTLAYNVGLPITVPSCIGAVDNGSDTTTWVYPAVAPPSPNTQDSPYITLSTMGGTVVSYTLNKSYTMYLMFQPPPYSTSIWVPLAVIPWNWSGQAVATGGVPAFTLSAAPAPTAFPNGASNGSVNLSFPSWFYPCVVPQ